MSVYVEHEQPPTTPESRFWAEVIWLRFLGSRKGDLHCRNFFTSEMWNIVGTALFTKTQREAIVTAALTGKPNKEGGRSATSANPRTVFANRLKRLQKREAATLPTVVQAEYARRPPYEQSCDKEQSHVCD